MSQLFPMEEALISSLFSDETELFRTPAEPEAGDSVRIRFRILKNMNAQVTLLTGYPTLVVPMRKYKTDACFDWYDTELTCMDDSSVF